MKLTDCDDKSNEEKTANWRQLAAVTVALFLAWMAVNAVWGLTSDEPTLLSATLEQMMALQYWLTLGLCATLAIGLGALAYNNTALSFFGFILFSYVAGVAVSRYAYLLIDPAGGIPFREFSDTMFAIWERSFLLWPAVPMMVVYFAFRNRLSAQRVFRFGSWKTEVTGKSRTDSKESWSMRFVSFVVFVVIPLAIFMQWTVGFGPLKSGTMFVFIVPLSLLALFNGFTEELLFRGFFQSAFSTYLGSTAGIVAQGIFFGIHHWGASPDLVAGEGCENIAAAIRL